MVEFLLWIDGVEEMKLMELVVGRKLVSKSKDGESDTILSEK